MPRISPDSRSASGHHHTQAASSPPPVVISTTTYHHLHHHKNLIMHNNTCHHQGYVYNPWSPPYTSGFITTTSPPRLAITTTQHHNVMPHLSHLYNSYHITAVALFTLLREVIVHLSMHKYCWSLLWVTIKYYWVTYVLKSYQCIQVSFCATRIIYLM